MRNTLLIFNSFFKFKFNKKPLVIAILKNFSFVKLTNVFVNICLSLTQRPYKNKSLEIESNNCFK